MKILVILNNLLLYKLLINYFVMTHRLVTLLFIAIFICSCKSDDDNITNEVDIDPISKNNVLLIIADDIGLDATIGYNIGAQKPNMPNLQNLINSGVKFNNVWSNPVCSPTRSTILTGKYGYRTSVLNVDDQLSTSETSLHKYLTQIKQSKSPNKAIISASISE